MNEQQIIDCDSLQSMLLYIVEHICKNRYIKSKDYKGKTVYDSFIGNECLTCNCWFRCNFKAIKKIKSKLLLNKDLL